MKLIQQELIEQETILQKQRKIATEIYETKLKSEIIELLDEKIEQKRNLINELIKDIKESINPLHTPTRNSLKINFPINFLSTSSSDKILIVTARD